MHELCSGDRMAVVHLLMAPRIAARTAPYILDDDFDWAGLATAAETMSGGERLLVDIARDLWEAERTVSVAAIPNRLDDANFRRVVEAFTICRSWSLDTPRRLPAQPTSWALEALRAVS